MEGTKIMPPEMIESEPKKRRPVNIFRIEDEERHELVTQIAEYKGAILLMVHPFWYEKFDWSPADFPDTNDIPEKLGKLLAKKGPPIVLALDPRDMDPKRGDFPRWFMDLPIGSRPVYYYGTVWTGSDAQSNPEPYDPKVEELQSNYGRWDYLVQQLRSLGVTKIMVGGSNVIGSAEEKRAIQCVPLTLRVLRHHFGKVLLSNVSLPHGPAFLMDWETDMGTTHEQRLTRGSGKKK